MFSRVNNTSSETAVVAPSSATFKLYSTNTHEHEKTKKNVKCYESSALIFVYAKCNECHKCNEVRRAGRYGILSHRPRICYSPISFDHWVSALHIKHEYCNDNVTTYCCLRLCLSGWFLRQKFVCVYTWENSYYSCDELDDDDAAAAAADDNGCWCATHIWMHVHTMRDGGDNASTSTDIKLKQNRKRQNKQYYQSNGIKPPQYFSVYTHTHTKRNLHANTVTVAVTTVYTIYVTQNNGIQFIRYSTHTQHFVYSNVLFFGLFVRAPSVMFLFAIFFFFSECH